MENKEKQIHPVVVIRHKQCTFIIKPDLIPRLLTEKFNWYIDLVRDELKKLDRFLDPDEILDGVDVYSGCIKIPVINWTGCGDCIKGLSFEIHQEEYDISYIIPATIVFSEYEPIVFIDAAHRLDTIFMTLSNDILQSLRHVNDRIYDDYDILARQYNHYRREEKCWEG